MTQSDFKVEWLYSNIRWFYLVAVAAILGIQTTVTPAEVIFTPTIIALLITGAVANLLVMLLLMLNAFRRPMTFFTLTLDVALTLGLIQATGGPSSSLIFVAFIPIITTALRYSWPVSLLVAVATVLLYWWTAWQVLDLSFSMELSTLWNQFLIYVTNGLILLTAGVAMSRVGYKIRQLLLVERKEEERESQAALDSAHQRVRLIFELASTLSATLNYERVLQAALDVSQAGLRELVGREISQIQMILLFGMDQSLYVATSHGLTASDRRVRFPVQAGALADSLKKAGAVVVDEPGTDPELGKIIAMHQCRQASVVPLRAGFESYGVMVVASTEDNVYTKDFQDLLDAICNQAVMALQNAQLYQNLMEEKERLVAVEEDARKKLARDLHDGPTQTIAAIAMRLNYIRMLISREPERAHEELQQLEDLARRTTKIIRQMLFTLRPLILESQGLVAALEQYRAKVTETDDITIHLEAEEEINRYLDKEAQGAVFYIVEEAMTNARKHSQASDLWIRLYKRGMNVVAEVEDNGVGFDVASVEESYAERTSLGMLNLRERASLAGGKTVIKSTPGKGTKISVTIPINENALAHGR